MIGSARFRTPTPRSASSWIRFRVSRTVRPNLSSVCTTITSPARAYPVTACRPGRSTVEPDFCPNRSGPGRCPSPAGRRPADRGPVSTSRRRYPRVNPAPHPACSGSQIRTDESTLNNEHNIWDSPASVNLVVRPTSRRLSHFQGSGMRTLHRLRAGNHVQDMCTTINPFSAGDPACSLQGEGIPYRLVQLIRRDRWKRLLAGEGSAPCPNW